MPRKTYGSEHIITHWGQSTGLGMMALGGLIALAGGILFAVAIVPTLRASDTPVAVHPGTHQHQIAPHGVDT